jgi:hypothetical protein
VSGQNLNSFAFLYTASFFKSLINVSSASFSVIKYFEFSYGLRSSLICWHREVWKQFSYVDFLGLFSQIPCHVPGIQCIFDGSTFNLLQILKHNCFYYVYDILLDSPGYLNNRGFFFTPFSSCLCDEGSSTLLTVWMFNTLWVWSPRQTTSENLAFFLHQCLASVTMPSWISSSFSTMAATS